MANVVLVMTYPYEAFAGGEHAYVAALRRFLISRGHRVDTIISDVTRGRTSPVLSLPASMAAAGAVTVRRTILCGGDRRLSLDPRLLGKFARRLAGRPVTHHEESTAGERVWLNRRLAAGGYDASIYLWDACRYVPAGKARVLALRGFFTAQSFSLGDTIDVAIDPALAGELADCPLVGLNNRLEVAALQRLRDPSDVIFVGMGFAPRTPEPLATAPVVLFVGANSEPNRVSIRWFVEDVWPGIIARHAGAQLHVAGTVCDTMTGDLPATIRLLGRVDDLAATYASAQVVVTPLVMGSAGVKTKVAEALSFGIPLVTTSLGVDPGDPTQFDGTVDVVDDAPGFAAAVNRLLADPTVRADRARLSIAAFDRNFSNDAAYAELADRLAL